MSSSYRGAKPPGKRKLPAYRRFVSNQDWAFEKEAVVGAEDWDFSAVPPEIAENAIEVLPPEAAARFLDVDVATLAAITGEPGGPATVQSSGGPVYPLIDIIRYSAQTFAQLIPELPSPRICSIERRKIVFVCANVQEES